MVTRTTRERPGRLRIAAVGYLNARPLLYGLKRDAVRGRFHLEFDRPGRCSDRLAAGDVDLALIPSIEYARQGRYAAVPGVCISTDGPAESVLVFSRVPLESARRIAVDSSSRTSHALLRILLREAWNVDPEFVIEEPDPEGMLARHDAALLIGDPALFTAPAARAEGLLVTDLGAAWKDLTGLPFVFAFWAGPEGVAGGEAVEAVQDSLRAGLAHLPEIAETSRWKGEPRPEIALPYLRNTIRYLWTQRESDGLLRFYLLAGRHGLLQEIPDMAYFGEPVGTARRG